MVRFLIVESGCDARDTEYLCLEEENVKKGSHWELCVLTWGAAAKVVVQEMHM